MRELEYPFPDTILKKKKSIKRQLLARDINYIDTKIAILGGSTTNDILAMLELFLLNYGIRPAFYESEYSQYYEDVMFSNPKLEEFDPDVIIFFTSIRNINQYPNITDSAENVQTLLNETYAHFEQMWKRVAEVYHCMIIQNNFELPFYRLMGNKDASDIHGKVNFITRLNLRFYEYAQQNENFYIHDINYESATYGLEAWSDPYYWYMYKYALCVPAIPYTSFNLANIIKSYYGKNKKALALDLDNTLWGGVVGDDGAENIDIGQDTPLGQTYSEFQNYIKEQTQLGVLLTIDSKNERYAALSGLHRPDSVLKEEDFVSIKANWDPKDQNLREIAQELNLLPESFVFVDDNPAEREIVGKQIEGIATPEMTEAEHYIQMLDKNGYFEVTDLSKDDLKRNEMYRENAQRVSAQLAFSDYTDYLHSLEMKATIKEFEPMYLARIAQLTNKSNQFNLTTKRYSLAEIEESADDASKITLYGKLEDKFGDNGVVSVVIGRIKEDELHMELWIMSCRVLKRDMEFAMMDELAEQCRSKGIRDIYGYYYPTVKNGMVKDFYRSMNFKRISEDADGNTVWKFQIEENYENKNHVITVNGKDVL